MDKIKSLHEKYLSKDKTFTAIRDLEDYDIQKNDKVKIEGLDLSNGYFGLVNLRTNKPIRMYSLEFIKNFR